MKPSALLVYGAMAAALLLSLPQAAGAAAEEGRPDHLLIGIIPEVNIFQQRERYAFLADYLTRKTGVEVRLTSLSDYGNVLETFRSRHLDGAFFGSFTGALASERLEVEAIARPVTPDGLSTYHGLVFARKDSGIRGPRDMKGKVMAFVDKASSCGYLFPLAYFRENGITDVGALFSEIFFTGSHDAAIEAVFRGNADVGVAKNTIFDRAVADRPWLGEELLVLARSPEYPSHSFFLRRSLAEDIRKAFRKALLGMENDAEGQAALQGYGALRFVDTDTKRDYMGIFDTARKAGIDLKTFDYREPDKRNLQFPVEVP